MVEKAAAMNLGQTIIPNVTLMGTAGLQTNMDRRPENITAIRADSIEIGERLRPLDLKKVKEIAESIRDVGLLHPIGVKRSTKPGGNYRLIYGYHRVAAVKLLAAEDPTQVMIGAAIYPAKMPDWACQMNEAAENAHRKDLSQKQIEAHTTIYAGLLKKHGKVRTAEEIRATEGGRPSKETHQHGAGELKARGKTPRPQHEPALIEEMPRRTVTQQVAEDLGISTDTVRRHIANTVKTAATVGFHAPEGKKTPEELPGEAMIATGKAALMAKAERQPSYPQDGKVKTDLDPTDPAPFIAWCRKRLNGEHKPMSLDMLRAYRKALDDLIAEYEAKKD